jgi:hypothetical protein
MPDPGWSPWERSASVTASPRAYSASKVTVRSPSWMATSRGAVAARALTSSDSESSGASPGCPGL